MKELQNIWQKFLAIPLLKKLNQHSFMPIIWWGVFIAAFPYFFSLIQLPIVVRVGLVFLILNSIISFHVGVLIKKRSLSKWWMLFLPVIFCLAILPRFANYNLVFGLIYLIFEVFGLINNHIYR